jgi:hypothetical protein
MKSIPLEDQGPQELIGAVVKVPLAQALANKHERIVRQRYAKTTVREYLGSLTAPLNEQYLKFHEEHRYFDIVCAGAKHHHYWINGLREHVSEMIGYLLDLFDLYRGDLENKVTRDDMIIACYLHDFAKVWTYELITEEDREADPKRYLPGQFFKPVGGAFNLVDEESKTLLELSKWGIHPTESQWSAVLFAEGGYSDANFTINGLSRTSDVVMHCNPLAVLVHMADMYSAMILGGSLV